MCRHSRRSSCLQLTHIQFVDSSPTTRYISLWQSSVESIRSTCQYLDVETHLRSQSSASQNSSTLSLLHLTIHQYLGHHRTLLPQYSHHILAKHQWSYARRWDGQWDACPCTVLVTWPKIIPLASCRTHVFQLRNAGSHSCVMWWCWWDEMRWSRHVKFSAV